MRLTLRLIILRFTGRQQGQDIGRVVEDYHDRKNFSVLRTSAAWAKERQLQVFVRDNNVEQALRVLKKKMQREGVFREMKQRQFYEKPSERSVREKAESVRRARKLARKQAQREGLIAAPAKKKLLDARRDSRQPGSGTGGVGARPRPPARY